MSERTSGPEPASYAGGADVRPVVPLPSGGPPAGVILVGFVILALGLFVFLEGRRHEAAHDHSTARHPVDESSPPASPPTLEVPAPAPASAPPPAAPNVVYVERPTPAPPPVIQYVERPSAPAYPPIAAQEPIGARTTEPALVIDLTDQATAQAQQPEDSPAHATVLAHKSALVAQGTVIPAVLETPIDSSQPGAVRAITSADTRGFDQARVLIPKGSRLFGEYRSDVQSGQARVLVTWTRLVRPDGVSVRLTSPGADRRGGIGFPGAVDDHLIAHVGSVVLQSALAAGVNLASRPANGGSSVVINSPAPAFGTAGPALLPGGDAKPTITVKEGAEISAFVARDLDFSGALPRS